MLCLTYGATSLVKGVDKGKVGLVLLVDLEAQVSVRMSWRYDTSSPYIGKPIRATTSCNVGLIMPNGKQKAFADVFQNLRKPYNSPKLGRISFLEKKIMSYILIFFQSSPFSIITLSSN